MRSLFSWLKETHATSNVLHVGPSFSVSAIAVKKLFLMQRVAKNYLRLPCSRRVQVVKKVFNCLITLGASV